MSLMLTRPVNLSNQSILANSQKANAHRQAQQPTQSFGTDKVFFGSQRGDASYWAEKQRGAEEERKALHPVFQFLFPLPDRHKVGIDQMEKVKAAIEGMLPLDSSLLAQIGAEIDQQGKSSKAKTSQLSKAYQGTLESQICQDVLEEMGLSSVTAPKPIDALYMLQHLHEVGVDGGELRTLLSQLAPLHETFLEQQKREAEIVQIPDWLNSTIFRSLSFPILKSLALLGEGVLRHEIESTTGKFLRLISSIDALSKDKELYNKLFQVCHLPVASNTSTEYQYTRIAQLTYGLSQLGARKQAMQLLDAMISRKQATFELMAGVYLQALSLEVGASQVDTAAWDLSNVHQLSTIIVPSQDNITLKFKNVDELRGLLKATFDQHYLDYLHDRKTLHGQANLKTQEAFGKAGLNYEQWLRFPQEQQCRLSDGKVIMIGVWKRKPETDLFQGSYGQSCAALSGAKGQIAVDDLQYTLLQTVELKDAKTKKNVGNAMTYWAQDKQGPFLIIDNIQMQTAYRDSSEIRDGIVQYVQKYAEAVAGHPVPIKLGRLYNRVPVKDLTGEKTKFKVIGATSNDKYHLNSLVKHEKLYTLNPFSNGQSLTGSQNVLLYAV